MRIEANFLLGALCAFVIFQFALNSGISETAIWVAAGFVLLLGYHGECVLHSWPRPFLGLGTAVFAALVVTWTASYGVTDLGRSERLVKLFALAAATYCAARTVRPSVLLTAAASIIAGVVIWQFAARHIGGRPYGEFSNPHYLAYFILLLLPPLVFISSRIPQPLGFGYALLLMPALDLVLNDLTKPAIPLLALSCAISVTLLVTAATWRPRAAAILVGLGIIVGTAVAPLALKFFVNDERFTLWTDALRMVEDGMAWKWIFGNGLGSFRGNFADFATADLSWLTFPHNFFIEVLYELGLPILVIITTAYVYLTIGAVKLTLVQACSDLRALARVNLAVLVIWSFFSFFAFSAFSAYTLYPLAFIIGFHLVLSERFRVRVNAVA